MTHQETSTAKPHGETRRLRVLIADPDADIRKLYREAIETTGCEVVEAEDGRDALVSALATPPALVITDAWLPFFDGYALCEVLRRDSATKQLPVLVITSADGSSELDRARKAGADGVLVKPVSSEDLLQQIQRLLGQPIASTSGATTSNRNADLACPSCGRVLVFERTHSGGVGRSLDQCDEFRCPGLCGRYVYRPRTRQLRKAV
jgi:twitching motility two-component system response regulator PilG